MDVYLVGGAVRDALLGLPVKDRDWVVVGQTQAAMEAAGFRPVGRDFPVFLHPDTHEEHALARTERKSGTGYRGFVVDADPSVTLEEDLARRDLTINAIAQAADGTLIDPFGGRDDIASRTLRHVSEAFVEDPVRVLRAARFMARLAPLGFTLAEETLTLMRRMVDAGEIDHLVPERVWQELDGALAAAAPRACFDTLRRSGALHRLLPELDALFGVPQPERHHPEIDAGEHTLLVLQRAAESSEGTDVRFAALCHDLGKGTTPPDEWPSHRGHEERGAALVESLCERLRVPVRTRDLARLCARFHTRAHRVDELRDATLADLLQSLDAQRRPERFERFLQVCAADARGRGSDTHPLASRPYPQADMLRAAAAAWSAVDAKAVAAAVADKRDIPEAIRGARIAALTRWRRAPADDAADDAGGAAAG